jgi:hypothetical protein
LENNLEFKTVNGIEYLKVYDIGVSISELNKLHKKMKLYIDHFAYRNCDELKMIEDGFNRFCLENPKELSIYGCGLYFIVTSYFPTLEPIHTYRKPSSVQGDEWNGILERYNHRCFYCGDKKSRLTRDHVVPVSKGGSDTVNNIVPACWHCNYSKRAKPVEQFKEGIILKLV